MKFFQNLAKSSSSRSVIHSLKRITDRFRVTLNISHVRSLLPHLSTSRAVDVLADISAQRNKTLVFRRSNRALPLPNAYQLSKKSNKTASTDDSSNVRFIKSAAPSYLAFQLGRQHVYDYVQTRYKGFTNLILSTYASGLYPISFSSMPLLLRTRIVQIPNFSHNWLSAWARFTTLYMYLGLTPLTEIYVQARKAKPIEITHNLYMRFNGHRLIITLADDRVGNTHFFLSTGLLLKYFERKKSIKKNKSMKLLMIRFLRKLLILLRLKNIVLKVRGVPLYMDILLAMLFRPLSHFFTDPFTGLEVDEIQRKKNHLNFSAIVFTKFKPFGYQKTKKRGRIKRKIRRKLVKLNAVID